MYTVKLVEFDTFFSPVTTSSTVFLNTQKYQMTWEIVRPEDPIFAPEAKSQKPLEANQFETLQEALMYLKQYAPQMVRYSSPQFNDEEAKWLCDFINNCPSLIYIGYHYNSRGGLAYRMTGNKLSNKGYSLITQTLDMNPRIIGCVIGNHQIDKELHAEREKIMARNQEVFHIKDPLARTIAYRKIFASIREKYNLPKSFGLQDAHTQLPTLAVLAKHDVQTRAQTVPLPLESLPSSVLSELVPPTVDLAKEMERLSLLRSPDAKKIELLYLWKTLHTDVKPPIQSTQFSLPYFYCPPRLC